jgi:hypothetical protein
MTDKEFKKLYKQLALQDYSQELGYFEKEVTGFEVYFEFKVYPHPLRKEHYTSVFNLLISTLDFGEINLSVTRLSLIEELLERIITPEWEDNEPDSDHACRIGD